LKVKGDGWMRRIIWSVFDTKIFFFFKRKDGKLEDGTKESWANAFQSQSKIVALSLRQISLIWWRFLCHPLAVFLLCLIINLMRPTHARQRQLPSI